MASLPRTADNMVRYTLTIIFFVKNDITIRAYHTLQTFYSKQITLNSLFPVLFFCKIYEIYLLLRHSSSPSPSGRLEVSCRESCLVNIVLV